MFNFSAIAGNGYHRYMNYVARKQAMQVLVRQSDATLRDIGISKELLNSGLAGWPWYAPETNPRKRPITEQPSTQQPLTQGGRYQATELKPVHAAGGAAGKSKRPRIAEAYHNMVSRARAIKELRQLSDRELSDLGITRGTIVEAVTNGRPGVENARAERTAVAAMVHDLNLSLIHI